MQLHKLFTLDFRRAFEILLNRSLLHGKSRTICTVDLCWIDKIPVAKSPALTKKTEIGDAVLFAFDQRRDPKGLLSISSARCLILQAKVARSKGQLATPKVPIGTGRSTDNELTLLSNWPTFNLYNTGSSKVPLLKGITVSGPHNPAPHAWFIVAPGHGLSSANKGKWPCWWMAGKAKKLESCDASLGTLIAGFLSKSSDVGADFVPQIGPSSSVSLQGNADWSALCNEIRKVASAYSAPPSLFGLNRPRIYHVVSRLLARSNSPSDIDLVRRALAADYHPDLWPLYTCCDNRGMSGGESKRVPVLTVTTTRLGEDFVG
tara:strand:- start:82 stop:1038 length:957 start_codon:yes stop_codon:yes gene_type:complete